jgi:hypothetical protein
MGATWQGPKPPPRAAKTVAALGFPLSDNPQSLLRPLYGAPRNARFLRLALNIFGWSGSVPENIPEKVLGLCQGWPIARIFVCGKDLVRGAGNALAVPKDQ